MTRTTRLLRAPRCARAAVVAVLTALAPLGCSPDDADLARVTYDLLDSLPAADAVAPRLRIDFGTSEARPALLSGWSWNESATDGATFVWAVNDEAVIELLLHGLRPSELRFRAWAGPAPASAPTAIELLADDTPLATVTLDSGPRDHVVAVDPGDWPTPVAVRLRLRHHPPPPPAADGRRRLASAWDWLELSPLGPAAAAAASDAPARSRGRLRIPPAVRLDYPVDLEPGSRLVAARVDPAPAALLVMVSPRDGEARVRPMDESGELDLGISELTVATLSLLADPASLRDGRFVEVERPRVVTARRHARSGAAER